MKQIAIEAREDQSTTERGHVVLLLRGLTGTDDVSTYLLRAVDPPQPRPDGVRWPGGERVPVAVRQTPNGIEVVVGPDVVDNPMLLAGTGVVIELPNVEACGEFLWPQAAAAAQPKRRRLASRVNAIAGLEPKLPAAPPLTVAPPPPAKITAIAPAPVRIAAPQPRPEAAAPKIAAIASDTPLQQPEDSPAAKLIVPAIAAIEPRRHLAPSPPAVTLWQERTRQEAPDRSLTGNDEEPALAPKASVSIANIEPLRAAVMPVVKIAPSPAAADAAPLSNNYDPPRAPRINDDGTSVIAPKNNTTPPQPAGESATTPAPLPQRAPLAELWRAVRTKPAQAFGHVQNALPQHLQAMATPRNLAAIAAIFLISLAATASILRQVSRPPADTAAAGHSRLIFKDARKLRGGGEDAAIVVPETGKPRNATAPNGPSGTPPGTRNDPPPPAPVAAMAPAIETCGEPNITTKPMPGGMMQASVQAPCRKAQSVTLTYGGMDFVRRTDSGGALLFMLDCIFGSDAALDAVFSDGSKSSAAVTALDLDRVSKVAVVWQAPVNLDLHAYEEPALPGTAGQVSAATPQSAVEAAEHTGYDGRPHGFMSSTDDGRAGNGAPGAKLEVYTVFHADRPAGRSIGLALDFESRGSLPQTATCLGGALAEIDYEIIRRARTGLVTREPGQFAALPCGVPLPAPVRFNPSLLTPLRLAK